MFGQRSVGRTFTSAEDGSTFKYVVDLEQVRSDCGMTGVDPALTNPVVRATLEDSGWNPEYRYDPSDWVESLQEEGFSVHASGLEALTLLGGLRILPPTSIAAAFATGALHVDPLWSASGESPRIRQREERLGVRLFPIGEWMDQYVVLVGDDGRVFAETTFEILELGEDLSDALIRVIVADSSPTKLSP